MVMNEPKRKQQKRPRYAVFFRRTNTGYSADVPDLPGCVAAAGSLRGTKRLIAEAIGLHIDLMQEHGERIPAPKQSIRFAADELDDDDFCAWVEVIPPRAISRTR